jgi:hypothetical protein
MTFSMVVIAMAAVAAGLFAGAAIYVTAVEHPARLSCGPELALREFAPSYKRGTIMQASLAVWGVDSDPGRHEEAVLRLRSVLANHVRVNDDQRPSADYSRDVHEYRG